MDNEQQQKKKGFQRFQSVKPQTVTVAPESLVRFAAWGNEALPGLVEPAVDEVDLVDWAAANRQEIEQRLRQHGALLLRGFDIVSAEGFERFASTLSPDLFSENGEHDRKSVSGTVYTPTFYPPEEKLLWHNENSFNFVWPRKIFFCCLQPAEEGGQTPLVDSREVYRRLDLEVRHRWERLGVMYQRNYGEGLGLDWRTVFRTDDRHEVERRCREEGLDLEWKPGDRLRTTTTRAAAVRHPQSGEPCWFNQAQHWHPYCLKPAVRESLEAMFRPQDMPRNCFFGDGSTIPDEEMEHVLQVYRDLEVSFPWRRGDVLVVDNVLAAHGRNPFAGERRILVAMGDMTTYGEVS